MMDQPILFGALLQRHRHAAGLSQQELAELAGLSRRGISDLERGVHQSPYPETVRRLADAMQLDQPERAAFLASAHLHASLRPHEKDGWMRLRRRSLH